MRRMNAIPRIEQIVADHLDAMGDLKPPTAPAAVADPSRWPGARLPYPHEERHIQEPSRTRRPRAGAQSTRAPSCESCEITFGTFVGVLIGLAWLGHGQRSKVHAEGWL